MAHMPSPLERMIGSINEDGKKTGMTCMIKRRLPDGSLQDADPRALDALGTKSRMAYAAQNLKSMAPEARTAWALEMKDFANTLYAQQNFVEAMEKYVEALAASDFGTIKSSSSVAEATASTSGELEPVSEEGNSDGDDIDIDLHDVGKKNISNSNIEVLVVPILCNLAACCLQIKQYSKARKFCDAALELKPKCAKALMRRGMSLVHVGEYDAAVRTLEAALSIEDGVIEVGREDAVDISDSRMAPIMPISESDRQRIPILLQRARKGKELSEKGKKNQRKALQKVFGSTGRSVDSHPTNTTTIPVESTSKAQHKEVLLSSETPDVLKLMFIGLVLAVLYSLYGS